ILVWAGTIAGLAAMAAAAIAGGSGVALPDDDVAAETVVGTAATGIATATGFGVVAAGCSFSTFATGSIAGSGEAVPSDDGFAVGRRVADDQRREIIVSGRWVGPRGLQRQRSLKRYAGYGF